MTTGVTTRMLLQFITKIYDCKQKGMYVFLEQWVVKKLTLFYGYVMQNIGEHVSQLQS
jgi:hypothetical protein